MYKARFIFVLQLLALAATNRLAAQPNTPPETRDADNSVCQIIEAAAKANALPGAFFTRVIWQESHFRPEVIGPVTRSGQRAQGIAQFMPGTAAERNLLAPFNPAEALPNSGEFLAELRAQFGNLGLAAAAYNAGPQRLCDFLAGSRDLPTETRNYVFAITGHPIEDWTAPVTTGPSVAKPGEQHSESNPATCRDLLAQLERTSNSVVVGWQQRDVPSWCKGLHHPNVSVCGPVHLAALVIRQAGAVRQHSHVHLPRTTSR